MMPHVWEVVNLIAAAALMVMACLYCVWVAVPLLLLDLLAVHRIARTR